MGLLCPFCRLMSCFKVNPKKLTLAKIFKHERLTYIKPWTNLSGVRSQFSNVSVQKLSLPLNRVWSQNCSFYSKLKTTSMTLIAPGTLFEGCITQWLTNVWWIGWFKKSWPKNNNWIYHLALILTYSSLCNYNRIQSSWALHALHAVEPGHSRAMWWPHPSECFRSRRQMSVD